MDWVTLRSRGKELVRKYRYVLLVVLAGLFLMALPDGKNTKAAPEPAAAETEPRQDLQTGLEEILSQIQGAGRVRVLLTQREGERTVYQTDEDSTSSGIRSDTVLLNGSDRSQTSRSIPLLISARSSYARGRTARPSGLPSYQRWAASPGCPPTK